MNDLIDRFAELAVLAPIYAWNLVCRFVKYGLRLQTIVCRSQYAVVVENGGNVATLEQWDDSRVQICRRNVASGGTPASVEQFLEFLPAGRIVDANAAWYRKVARPAQTSKEKQATPSRR
jgi:hypothetical protein